MSKKWKPGGFITVPNKNYIYDLSPAQLKTYLALCDMAGNKGKCWPSYETIAQRIKCTRRAVMYAVTSLQDAGYIKVVSKVNNHSNHYEIVELTSEPTFTSSKPKVVNADAPASEPVFTSGVNVGSPALVNVASPKQTQENKPIEENNSFNKELERVAPSDIVETDDSVVAVKQQFGDPDVNRVVEAWESHFGRLPKLKLQRYAAKRLINLYGVEKVVLTINSYAVVWQRTRFKHCPRISNLVNLAYVDEVTGTSNWVRVEYACKQVMDELEKAATADLTRQQDEEELSEQRRAAEAARKRQEAETKARLDAEDRAKEEAEAKRKADPSKLGWEEKTPEQRAHTQKLINEIRGKLSKKMSVKRNKVGV